MPGGPLFTFPPNHFSFARDGAGWELHCPPDQGTYPKHLDAGLLKVTFPPPWGQACCRSGSSRYLAGALRGSSCARPHSGTLQLWPKLKLPRQVAQEGHGNTSKAKRWRRGRRNGAHAKRLVKKSLLGGKQKQNKPLSGCFSSQHIWDSFSNMVFSKGQRHFFNSYFIIKRRKPHTSVPSPPMALHSEPRPCARRGMGQVKLSPDGWHRPWQMLEVAEAALCHNNGLSLRRTRVRTREGFGSPKFGFSPPLPCVCLSIGLCPKSGEHPARESPSIRPLRNTSHVQKRNPKTSKQQAAVVVCKQRRKTPAHPSSFRGRAAPALRAMGFVLNAQSPAGEGRVLRK